MNTLDTARRYIAAGFSIIPIRADGSKAPDGKLLPQEWDEAQKRMKRTWKPYQAQLPTDDDLSRWFGNGTAGGIAIVWGAISGNGEVMDFDKVGIFEEFEALCREYDAGDLVASLPLIETPSGGRHLPYRCPDGIAGNKKLARDKSGDVLIETRGEGGYTLAPGSPPECHEARRPYVKLRGDLSDLPTITGEQRALLHAVAASFNLYEDPKATERGPAPSPKERDANSGPRPGDDYNERGDVLGLLAAEGWDEAGQRNGTIFLRRPGKQGRVWSATYNHGGHGLFHCFTSSAPPFDVDTSYSPFAVFAYLKHDGGFAEAARDLGKQGYGSQVAPAVRRALQTAATAEPEEEATPTPSDADAPPSPKKDTLAAKLADFNPTDAGNAERLIALRSDDLRFVRRMGWRTWNGRHWEAGEEAVIRLARETIRALFGVAGALLKEAEAEQDKDARRVLVAKSEGLAKHALRSEQTPKLAAMVKQASTFTEITAEPNLFNLRAWIVPFANAVWERGQWREHRREDYAERLLPVAYETDADRSEWNALLERITGGDRELGALFQDVAGYAFSGASSLRFLPWLYGPKGAGKSTFAELLQTALGANGKALDWSLVSGDRSGEELGRAIRGTRAVFLPEAGKKRLDPEILKLLSGSDSIPCRELYQSDSFTIPPTWALMATSNDPPNLTAYDDALKDRVKALPFVHILADGPPLRFTGAQRLEEVRRDPESPLVRGFAAWAVEGLERVYRNQAIQRAAAAEKHTRQFWADTDPLTPFWAGLEEAELRTGMITEKLRGAYIAWCDYEGIKKRLAGKAWGDACHSVGLESWRTQDARGWRIPKKAPWPYANDGMTDSGLFSEKSSIENSHVESLPKKGIIPSFRHYSVIDGTPQTKTTPAPPNSRPLPDRTGDDEALEDYEEVQY